MDLGGEKCASKISCECGGRVPLLLWVHFREPKDRRWNQVEPHMLKNPPMSPIGQSHLPAATFGGWCQCTNCHRHSLPPQPQPQTLRIPVPVHHDIPGANGRQYRMVRCCPSPPHHPSNSYDVTLKTITSREIITLYEGLFAVRNREVEKYYIQIENSTSPPPPRPRPLLY